MVGYNEKLLFLLLQRLLGGNVLKNNHCLGNASLDSTNGGDGTEHHRLASIRAIDQHFFVRNGFPESARIKAKFQWVNPSKCLGCCGVAKATWFSGTPNN